MHSTGDALPGVLTMEHHQHGTMSSQGSLPSVLVLLSQSCHLWPTETQHHGTNPSLQLSAQAPLGFLQGSWVEQHDEIFPTGKWSRVVAGCAHLGKQAQRGQTARHLETRGFRESEGRDFNSSFVFTSCMTSWQGTKFPESFFTHCQTTHNFPQAVVRIKLDDICKTALHIVGALKTCLWVLYFIDIS